MLRKILKKNIYFILCKTLTKDMLQLPGMRKGTPPGVPFDTITSVRTWRCTPAAPENRRAPA